VGLGTRSGRKTSPSTGRNFRGVEKLPELGRCDKKKQEAKGHEGARCGGPWVGDELFREKSGEKNSRSNEDTLGEVLFSSRRG